MSARINEVVCKICNKDCTSKSGRSMLRQHVKKVHNISDKEYYDKYLKKELDGKCLYCKKSTKFKKYLFGYTKYCSITCQNKYFYNTFGNDPNYRANISKRFKDMWKDKKCREKILKTINSEKHKIKLSNSIKEKWKDKSYREKQDNYRKSDRYKQHSINLKEGNKKFWSNSKNIEK